MKPVRTSMSQPSIATAGPIPGSLLRESFRDKVVRKLALGGSLALLLVISSIIAPTPAMAEGGSPPPPSP
jgi:hypothetical protein